MRVLALLSLLCVAPPGAVQAAPAATCQVAQLVSVPVAYSAQDGARGQVRIHVTCPASGRYRVQFSTQDGPLAAPAGPVVLRGAQGELRGEVQGIPLDRWVQGARTFELPLVLPAGQWAAQSGAYQVLFTVTAESVAGERP